MISFTKFSGSASVTVSGADVFDVLDKRWKEFAENSQELGGEGKKR